MPRTRGSWEQLRQRALEGVDISAITGWLILYRFYTLIVVLGGDPVGSLEDRLRREADEARRRGEEDYRASLRRAGQEREAQN